MPTAIVRVYTSEGFVIGADGRCRHAETGIISSDSERKIFSIENSGRALVYCFQGTTGITDTITHTVVVDLIAEIEKSISAMAQARSRHDLTWYVSKVWKPTYDLLVETKKTKDVGIFPEINNEPGLIAQVLFFGYYRKVAVELALKFLHENQKIMPPKLFPSAHLSPVVAYGSRIVGDLLFASDDSRFDKFRTSVTHHRSWRNLNLSQAVEIVTSYIRACDSDEGRTVDPKICAGIGGDIHIAEIRSPGVFRWIQEPKQNTSPRFGSLAE